MRDVCGKWLLNLKLRLLCELKMNKDMGSQRGLMVVNNVNNLWFVEKYYDPCCHGVVDFDHFRSHASSSNPNSSKHCNTLTNQNLIFLSFPVR